MRTCDGGFFPITAGATPLDFRRDEKVCAMMCPQTQTELYYHSLSSQETEDMVSAVTGKPYSMLPSAFAYRTRDLSKPSQCGCDLSAYYQEMIRREKALKGDGDDVAAVPVTALGTFRNNGRTTVHRIPDSPATSRHLTEAICAWRAARGKPARRRMPSRFVRAAPRDAASRHRHPRSTGRSR